MTHWYFLYTISFSIRQIKCESFLEDINSILNSGDVPNLYAADEQERILTAMKPMVQDLGQQPTKANLMAAYLKKVRSNVHTVLCMRLVTVQSLLHLFNSKGKNMDHVSYMSLQCTFQMHTSPFHFFLCSPVGEVFRARLRQFPSLVTCCTIDWFSAWPEEALQAVASSFLSELPELEASTDVMKGLVRIKHSFTSFTHTISTTSHSLRED